MSGATTNSDAGVTDLKKVLPVLKTMADAGVLLLVHGEVTDNHVDMFDREAVFIREKLVRGGDKRGGFQCERCGEGWHMYG